MMPVDHSLVTAPKQDHRYVGLRAAETLGYIGLHHRSSQHPDFSGLLRGQKLFEASDETTIDSVLFVELIGGPLEVDGTVVGFHAVNVIDDGKIARIGHEGHCDKAVEEESPSSCISKQPNQMVSEAMDAGFENLSPAPLQAMTPHAHSVKASNATDVADLVKSFETSNASPFFINHLMGPFARSAHSIVLSSTTQGGPACLFH